MNSRTAAYDSYGRLATAVSAPLTVTYAYRDIGTDYTTAQVSALTNSFGSQTESLQYTYDANGNILTVGDGTNTVTYTYDALNQLTREENTAAGKAWDYTYDHAGNILTRTETDALYFRYDVNGTVSGFLYKTGTAETEYTYLKNLQGDILGILDPDGSKVAAYSYDAWGNILTVTGSNLTLANRNPIRYRGYYYDTETQLYYLQSRYYSPELGRFISADAYTLTYETSIGANMFAYCGNEPVNRVDPLGCFGNELLDLLLAASCEMGTAVQELIPAYSVCGGAALIDGPLPFGDIAGISGAAILTAGAVGYGLWQATNESKRSKAYAYENEIADTSDISKTVIYRYGGTNPSNLTPREKDRYTGLSFSTIPRPGAAMTTIEELNSTGIVFAVRDSATHVSVIPIGGSIDDWIRVGVGSVWTQAVKAAVTKYGG